jgi:1-acyl-sn-glycerol-3-phosphate acyltransferase
MWALLVLALLVGAALRWCRRYNPALGPGEYLAAFLFGMYARCWHGCSINRWIPVSPSEGALLIANHTTSADAGILQAGCFRPLSFLIAEEFTRFKPARWFLDYIYCVPVKRNGHDVAAVRISLERLRASRFLVVFPEGNLSNAGRHGLRRGRCGAAYLALRSRARVFPAFIAGGPRTSDVLSSWLWPSRARLFFGDAIDLSAYYDRPINRKLLEEVTSYFMECIARLEPCRQRERHLFCKDGLTR